VVHVADEAIFEGNLHELLEVNLGPRRIGKVGTCRKDVVRAEPHIGRYPDPTRPRRRRPARRHRILRRRGARQGHATRRPTPAARPRDPGRAAPDLGSARHDGRPLRNCDRGALLAADRGPRRATQDHRLDGDGASRPGPDTGALRAVPDADLPAAGPRPPGFVLRADGAGARGARAPLSRDRLAGCTEERCSVA
jgi:hypothetical protein